MYNLRVIIAGGRDFIDYEYLEMCVKYQLISLPYKPDSIEIISGHAMGADALGEKFAKTEGYSLKIFPADWEKEPIAAGHIRNRKMAEYAVSDGCKGMLIAFWDAQSKGTKNMIDTAKDLGLFVSVNYYNN